MNTRVDDMNKPERVLTPEEVASRSKGNIRLAIVLALVALAFFGSAWFLDISTDV